ncbi:MAG: hypothetical protein II922_06920 [Succinimonas sp.]|nr:hypothetical protein [Succinimonas sp.]
MKYAHSVIVELKREGLKLPFQLSYDGKSKDKFLAIRIDPLLPENEEKQFWDFYANWEQKSSGLFVDRESLLCFVLIIKSVFEDKYQTKYTWIGGTDPYEAWVKEQDKNPVGTIY